jgi:8-oxo-dGTP pyrophosphatase MutT (NUDIX family)
MNLLKDILYPAYAAWLSVARPITIGVRLLLVQDGQVLLVRHVYQDGWFLVGGGANRNETLEQTARREAREEAGAELGAVRLFGIYSHFPERRTDHITVFACEDFSLPGHHDREIAELRFFPLDRLPADMRPGNERRVQDYLRDPKQVAFGEW